MSLVFSLLSSGMFFWFLLFYLNTEEREEKRVTAPRERPFYRVDADTQDHQPSFYFWAISDAMKMTSGKVGPCLLC